MFLREPADVRVGMTGDEARPLLVGEVPSGNRTGLVLPCIEGAGPDEALPASVDNDQLRPVGRVPRTSRLARIPRQRCAERPLRRRRPELRATVGGACRREGVALPVEG